MPLPIQHSATSKRASSVPVIDENVVENAANLESWVTIGDILSRSSRVDKTTDESNFASEFKPAPADPSLLLPSTFAAVAQKRHIAHTSAMRIRRAQNMQRENEKSKLTSSLVIQAVKALRELRKHYDHLTSNSIDARNALVGHDKGSVIWISPEAQPDFIAFITVLNSQWGPEQQQHQQASSIYQSNSPSTSAGQPIQEDSRRVRDLVDWAMNADIDTKNLEANVDASATAYQTIEKAFRMFRLAFDDMVKLHERNPNESFSF